MDNGETPLAGHGDRVGLETAVSARIGGVVTVQAADVPVPYPAFHPLPKSSVDSEKAVSAKQGGYRDCRACV